MNNDMKLANQIEPYLCECFKDERDLSQAVELYPEWQYGRNVIRWLRVRNNVNKQRIIENISALSALNANTTAKWFKLMFAHTRHGRGHHNYQLADNVGAGVKYCGKTTGEVVKYRRIAFGLSINDLTTRSNESSIWRFEAGKTSISFVSLIHIAGEMGLLVSELINGVSNNHDFLPMTLRTAFQKINFGMTSATQDVITDFINQNANIPASVLSLELMILRESAGLPVDTSGNAQVTYRHMMQSKHWGALEMHALIPLADILSFEQLSLLFARGRHVIERHPLTVGINYYFTGLCCSITRMLSELSGAQLDLQLDEYRWLPRFNNSTSMRWRAVGLWYLARYSSVPTSEKRRYQLKMFVHLTLLAGHSDTIKALKSVQSSNLPDGFIDQCVTAFSS